MTFDFEEKQGDLFESIATTDSVVLCVTEDLKLASKGVTGSIRQRLANQLSQVQKKSVGQVGYFTVQQKRHVFYLVTRQKSYNKPSVNDIETCFIELRKLCDKLNVFNLALPRELEGLQEKYLKDVLFNVFQGWPGKMVMYQSPE
ncbi:hypothetical protein EDC94DRAFT_658021 [Helicostylum pulchrum]|nr:hypothetical protein EDC94DRAFT_658021 [Helicostylum pulchrum]